MRRLDVGRMKQLIAQAFPATKVKQVSSKLLLMNCLTPGHPDATPSFYVDLLRGHAYCKSPACCYSTRNLLQLLQDCRGWSYAEGLSQVQAITGVRLVSEKLNAQYDDLDQHRTALKEIAKAANAFLIGMLAPPEGDATYDPIAQVSAAPAITWLFDRRQHKKEYVPYLPYGLWPPANTLLAMCEKSLGDTAAEEYRQGNTTRLPPERRTKILDRIKKIAESMGTEWAYSVAFITGHDFNTPARIRLRRPAADEQKQGNIFTTQGYTPDEAYGYFGLYAPHLAGLTRREARSLRVLEVEGENDALSLIEGILAESITSWAVIASCGDDGTDATNTVDALASAGIETVYLLHDHPDPEQGRGEAWLRKKLVTAKVVDPRVFTRWNELRSDNKLAKDPDDVVRLVGFRHLKRIVLDDPDNSFVASDTWAITRAIEDGRDLDDARERSAIAAKYGECLAHPERLANFLDRVSGPLSVAPGVVRAQIVRGQDDEAGFVSRIADTITHDFHLLYIEDTPKGSVLHAYHKGDQRGVRLFVNDGQGSLMGLSNVIGDVYDYFSQRIGLPPWLSDARAIEAGTPVMRDLQKPLGDYTRLSLQRVIQGLPMRDECETVGLGPHVRHNPEAQYGVLQYVNTGQRVMRLTFVGEDKLKGEYLTGPSEGRMLFTQAPQPFTGLCKTPEDIEWGNTVTLDDVRETLHDLTKVIKNCWKFRRGDVEALLYALYIIHLCVPHFCPEKICCSLTGPTGSGKSKLMALVAGGQHPELQLVDFCSYQTNYTPAGLYVTFDGSTCCMALEEFTADGLHRQKSNQVEDITEILRQSIFPGGARIRRIYGGVPRVMVLSTNSLLTSIHPARDIQDANRRLEIDTVKVVGLQDPAVALLSHVTAERYAHMRKVLNLGLFKFYPKYQQIYAVVSHALATKDFGGKVETRFLRNLVGPATVLAMLGGDWEAFVRQVVASRKETLDAYANSTPTSILFDTLLRTNSVRVGMNYTSAMALLAEPDKYGVLNASTSGVLYNDMKGYLVVDWIAILSNGGILNKAEPFCREQYHRLKYQLDQHPACVRAEDYPDLGVEGFVNVCGVAFQPHTFSVYKIGPLVHALREVTLKRSAHAAPQHAPAPGTQLPPQQEATPSVASTGTSGVPPGMRQRNNI